MKNQAFTLIEILVVVLIIGILATIAVPQYRLSVAKSRLVQMELRGNALYKAAKVYELANGTWPTDVSVLDIDITQESVELKANKVMTASDHIAAHYSDGSSCGLHIAYHRYVWCGNDDIWILKTIKKSDDEQAWSCEGITDFGTKICASFNEN